jgi:hypothetical protein
MIDTALQGRRYAYCFCYTATQVNLQERFGAFYSTVRYHYLYSSLACRSLLSAMLFGDDLSGKPVCLSGNALARCNPSGGAQFVKHQVGFMMRE